MILDNASVQKIRQDFPFLQTHSLSQDHTKDKDREPLIYLDSAATSQKPDVVIDNIVDFYSRYNVGVHRGSSGLGAEVTNDFENARQTIAEFVGADVDEIIWTSGATEAINAVAYSFSNASQLVKSWQNNPEAFSTETIHEIQKTQELAVGPDDEIVVTEMEHHSNLVPWQDVAHRTGATLKYIPVDPQSGQWELDNLTSIITESTKVVAFSQLSNVLGFINPIEEIISRAHAVGALTVLDACQSAPHMSLDFKKIDVDFAAFSAHKMAGPTGVGALYGKRELLEKMPPFLTGGSMVTVVTTEEAQFLEPPLKFEAGTQPTAEVLAWAQAITYLHTIGMESIACWENYLGKRLLEGLEEIPGVRVLGRDDQEGNRIESTEELERIGLVSLSVEGIHAHDLGQYLDSQNIIVRTGHHCAQPLHRKLGIYSSTRASTYFYTTTEEVDAFIQAVKDAQEYFKSVGMID